MPTFIYTGSKKCRVQNLMECPICGVEFETADGVYVDSATLNDNLLVCAQHHAVSVEDEVAIQNSLQRAIDNRRGHVMMNGKLTKKYAAFKDDEHTKSL